MQVWRRLAEITTKDGTDDFKEQYVTAGGVINTKTNGAGGFMMLQAPGASHDPFMLALFNTIPAGATPQIVPFQNPSGKLLGIDNFRGLSMCGDLHPELEGVLNEALQWEAMHAKPPQRVKRAGDGTISQACTPEQVAKMLEKV